MFTKFVPDHNVCVFVNCIYLVVLNVCIKSAPSINSVECHLLAPQSEEIIAVRFCPSFFLVLFDDCDLGLIERCSPALS